MEIIQWSPAFLPYLLIWQNRKKTQIQEIIVFCISKKKERSYQENDKEKNLTYSCM